jgi:hypothetical protein
MYTSSHCCSCRARDLCFSNIYRVGYKQSELATNALQVDDYPGAGERRGTEPERRRPPSPRRRGVHERHGGLPPGFGLVRMQSQNLEQETEKNCTAE